ncbi:hypothetical protein [Streptomyces sp. 147326]
MDAVNLLKRYLDQLLKEGAPFDPAEVGVVGAGGVSSGGRRW